MEEWLFVCKHQIVKNTSLRSSLHVPIPFLPHLLGVGVVGEHPPPHHRHALPPPDRPVKRLLQPRGVGEAAGVVPLALGRVDAEGAVEAGALVAHVAHVRRPGEEVGRLVQGHDVLGVLGRHGRDELAAQREGGAQVGVGVERLVGYGAARGQGGALEAVFDAGPQPLGIEEGVAAYCTKLAV